MCRITRSGDHCSIRATKTLLVCKKRSGHTKKKTTPSNPYYKSKPPKDSRSGGNKRES